MKEGPNIAHIAALIGDPARANMLTALMSGKALTVSELAQESGITMQTASGHLTKLDAGGLLRAHKQGRHKYYALAGDHVARVLEGLMGLAAGAGHLRKRPGPKDAALRKARVCYNHLAGDMGTRMFDSFARQGLITGAGGDIALSAKGEGFARDFGIDLAALKSGKTPLCRECLDWSERRTHLAGSFGRAMLARIEALGWAKRDKSTRVVHFTPTGDVAFQALLNS